MKTKKNVLVFGATISGKDIYDDISRDYNIIGFIDNDKSKWGGGDIRKGN